MPPKAVYIKTDSLDGLDYVGDPPPERELSIDFDRRDFERIQHICSRAAEEFGLKRAGAQRDLIGGEIGHMLSSGWVDVHEKLGESLEELTVLEMPISHADSKQFSTPIKTDEEGIVVDWFQFAGPNSSEVLTRFGVSFAPAEQANRWEIMHAFCSGTFRDLYETNITGALLQGVKGFLKERAILTREPQEVHILEDELPAMMLFGELGFEPATPQDAELLEAIFSSRYSIGTLNDKEGGKDLARNWVVLDDDGNPVNVHLTKTVGLPEKEFERVYLSFENQSEEE
jgi:hypothetical protein